MTVTCVLFFSSFNQAVAANKAVAAAMIAVLLLPGCRMTSSSDSGSEATSAAPSHPVVPCEGPTFTFGAQDRLAWAATGIVRRANGAYVVDVGRELIFATNSYGKVTTSLVSLVCADCSRDEWDAFDAGLGKLIGKSVRAKGIVRPAWSVIGDAAVAKDTPAVQLSTRTADIKVLSTDEVAAANACTSGAP